jgi:hypothetical protein
MSKFGILLECEKGRLIVATAPCSQSAVLAKLPTPHLIADCRQIGGGLLPEGISAVFQPGKNRI